MFDLLRFWLIFQLFGLLALPMGWRLFAFLPDRGYAFAKALGLLGVGYLLWLGASFGLLRNSAGGAILALLVFALVGIWLGRDGLSADEQGDRPLLVHLRAQLGYIAVAELLFALAFILWAVFRSYDPNIAGTEKPMEFAFLNGILNSTQFPPHDPWLSGYGISYYYFGYVILNVVVLLSGVMPGVAFNLGLASIFALTLLGAFGLGYNLVRSDTESPAAWVKGALYGLLAAVFVGIMGNLEAVLESLQARGLMSPALHSLFDVKRLADAPVIGSFRPTEHWWWFRAARTVHDYNFAGTSEQEVIDEFPMFSFVLGDMHPHVLAIPFVLLVVALALNLLRRPAASIEPRASEPDGGTDEDRVEIGGWPAAWGQVTEVFGLNGWGLVLYGIALGALGFLNTWDFPIYLFMVVVIYAVRRGLMGLPLRWQLWQEVIVAFVSLAVVGIVAYLPFYLSFSSQAEGILPNVYNPTRFTQYLLMFGPFLVALFFLLIVAYRQVDVSRKALLQWLVAVLLIPAIFLAVAIVAISLAPGLRSFAERALSTSVAETVPRILSLRLTTPGTWLVVGVLLAAVAALVSRVFTGVPRRLQHNLAFALALFFTALLLTYGVEFVFLRDTFATRMNTVFKFYYQAWILMAVGSTYALYYISTRASSAVRVTAQVVVAILVLGGLLYPAFAIPSKANNFQTTPTLDGAEFVALYRPDEAAVIRWLVDNTEPDAVIVEAPGGSYTEYNTISAHSGRAALLGWGGHELQWRGSYDLPGQREPVIDTIYKNLDSAAIAKAVNDYDIDYLIVGPRELEKYHIPANRQGAFINLWEPTFEEGAYIVYRWRGG